MCWNSGVMIRDCGGVWVWGEGVECEGMEKEGKGEKNDASIGWGELLRGCRSLWCGVCMRVGRREGRAWCAGHGSH